MQNDNANRGHIVIIDTLLRRRLLLLPATIISFTLFSHVAHSDPATHPIKTVDLSFSLLKWKVGPKYSIIKNGQITLPRKIAFRIVKTCNKTTFHSKTPKDNSRNFKPSFSKIKLVSSAIKAWRFKFEYTTKFFNEGNNITYTQTYYVNELTLKSGKRICGLIGVANTYYWADEKLKVTFSDGNGIERVGYLFAKMAATSSLKHDISGFVIK